MAGLTREQIASRDAAKTADSGGVQLPETKPYRIRIGGAMYVKPKIVQAFDGTESVAYVTVLGERGDEIDLIAREAERLTALAAVKPSDEPLDYDEMNSAQLDEAVKRAGIKVASTSADPDQPLPSDKINALRTYDQGRAAS